MAKLKLEGKVATVEFTVDPEDGQILVSCVQHPEKRGCQWGERYDDLRDAAEYAEDHADRG